MRSVRIPYDGPAIVELAPVPILAAAPSVHMSPENTTTLYDRFPNLYAEHTLPPAESSMCWGFQCGDGWFDLLESLSEAITAHGTGSGLDIIATCVKEKFGGLRFRVRGGDDEVAALVEKAERASVWICQACSLDNGIGGEAGQPYEGARCSGCGEALGRY